MAHQSDSVSLSDLQQEITHLRRQLDEERTVRQMAEQLLEEKSEDLSESNRKLSRLNENLKQTILRRTKTLSSLISNLNSGVLLEDENRRILLSNQRIIDQFGLATTPDQLIGQDCQEVFGISHFFEKPGEFEKRVQELLEDKQLVSQEILKMKDGRVLERDFVPVETESEIIGFLWQYREVTEEFNYEEKIRASEEKYRGIIENMELGLLEVDRNHTIIKAYDHFCGMTGYAKGEIIGKNAIDLFMPEEYQQILDEQNTERASGKQGVYETQLRRKDGSLIWVLISGAPFYDDEGDFTGSIGIHYDITSRKKLENDLREARELAEKARDAEKDFLANMSHEIRNPINAIAGLINLLYDTKLSTEQLDYLNSIKYAADILLGLISDILDISKIEAGMLELNEREIDLRETVKAVVQTSQFNTAKSQLKFNYQIDTQLSNRVIADPTVINQIFLNLLSNAVKFTESGEITVELKLKEETEDHIQIISTVADTGMGITEDQLERIFESFRQASKQTKLKYGGTGLGLSIVRQLVRMYQGEITVKSIPDQGSAFTFTMTFRKPAETTGAKPITTKTSTEVGKKFEHVLVVEDNKINQQYLTGLLKKWGLQYDIANNGQEAVELIDQHQYDLVLMDIRMPVMDGYETTIRIRNAANNPNQSVPIVALTASALVDEKKRALAAGMDHHLTKPFSPDQLLQILNQLDKPAIAAEQAQPVFEFSDQLDQDYLNQFYGDDLSRAAVMFEIFLRTINESVEKLRKYYERKDLGGVREIAHQIKPNFAMVGLTNENDRLHEVEQAAISGDQKSVDDLLTGFFNEVEKMINIVGDQLSKMKEVI